MVESRDGVLRDAPLDELEPDRAFLAHPGWRGTLEKSRCAA